MNMLKTSRRSFLAGCAALGLTVAAGSALADAAASTDGVTQVNVSLEDNKVVVDVTEVEAGPVTFNVTNVSSPRISEFELLYNQRILGEKENMAPGLPTVSFTKTLGGGEYQLYAPGAEEEYTTFTVTGEAAAAPEGSIQEILAQGVQDYADYVATQMQSMKEAADKLLETLQGGDLEESKQVYCDSRPYYERAESAIDGFLMPGCTDVEDNTQNLDYLIDMRESSLDEAAGWHGFHAIERDLWENGEITDDTVAYAQELADNCTILVEQVIPTFADDLLPEDLANGAADLLEEVSTTKITGEEEAYSHIDLLDFRANVEGAQQAYACMRDGLTEINAELVEKIDAEFLSVIEMLDGYIDENEMCGYKLYDEDLKKSDSDKLSAAILPLHDDIASLAELVATA